MDFFLNMTRHKHFSIFFRRTLVYLSYQRCLPNKTDTASNIYMGSTYVSHCLFDGEDTRIARMNGQTIEASTYSSL